MNKRVAFTGVFLIVISFVLFGIVFFEKNDVTHTGTEDSYIAFTDSIGNEVILQKRPERVAVLFSSLCNVWKNAGGEVFVTVGESVERGLCADDVLLVDSGAGKTINNELLFSYEPDFVIYSSDVPAQKEAGELLQKAGIPVAGIRLESVEDYLTALKIFCRITGNENNYDTFGQSVKDDIDFILKNIQKRVAGEKEKPSFLFIRSGSSSSSCKAKRGDDHFAAKILEEFGCVNIADEVPLLLDGISTEEVLMKNPDYIFVSLMGNEQASRAYVEGLFQSEAYSTLNSRIIILEKQLFQYKPCEKWNLAYRRLGEMLYPVETETESDRV